MAGPLQAGQRVLLIDGRARRYLTTLKAGGQFHFHRGTVSHDDLVGRPDGSFVESSRKEVLLAVRPTLADYLLKMRRGAQVVYPKDIALILVFADIFPGAVVVEAGTGSASLTLALARAVGERGRVISYEVREDHHSRAAENVRDWYEGRRGLPENLELRLGDVREGVPERDLDRMILDLPEPWGAVGVATNCLAPGGILCCYLPTVPQVMTTVEAMRKAGFGVLETLEGLVRTWNVEGPSVRPAHRMVAHTGFIVTGRKVTI